MRTRTEAAARKMGDLPGRILAGFSGGCDSTALVLLLLERKVSLTCVHVNHGLRGKEADADEQFVRDFCSEHAVPLLVYHAAPPEHPSEGWAREARYAFFQQAMRESGADALALAHHLEDQAETVLLHLLRGSGLEGLCGMRRQSSALGMQVLRPLLECTRQELREVLLEQGQAWREDSTNAQDDYLRNQVRHQLLPMMETIAPGAGERIAHTGLILQKDADVLSEQMQFAEKWLGRKEIPLDLLRCAQGLQSRILRLWWEKAAGPRKEKALSYSKTAELQALLDAKTGAACNLPGGLRAVRGYRFLHMTAPGTCRDSREYELASGLTALGAVFEIGESRGETGDGKRSQAVPASWLKELTVRTRQTGDWIIPFGQQGKQPLKEYLIDRRVDQPFRDRIPLICRGKEVLVCCGVGAGGVPDAARGCDAGFVMISWHGDMPWMLEEKER